MVQSCPAWRQSTKDIFLLMEIVQFRRLLADGSEHMPFAYESDPGNGIARSQHFLHRAKAPLLAKNCQDVKKSRKLLLTLTCCTSNQDRNEQLEEEGANLFHEVRRKHVDSAMNLTMSLRLQKKYIIQAAIFMRFLSVTLPVRQSLSELSRVSGSR